MERQFEFKRFVTAALLVIVMVACTACGSSQESSDKNKKKKADKAAASITYTYVSPSGLKSDPSSDAGTGPEAAPILRALISAAATALFFPPMAKKFLLTAKTSGQKSLIRMLRSRKTAVLSASQKQLSANQVPTTMVTTAISMV